jgi:hypothetical protein
MYAYGGFRYMYCVLESSGQCFQLSLSHLMKSENVRGCRTWLIVLLQHVVLAMQGATADIEHLISATVQMKYDLRLLC